jgi:predicted DNA repair protein MutK
MTVGVYGLVAGIVKLDDLGLYLCQAKGAGESWKQGLGKALLAFAPWLMKALSVVGTAAMFMVGGGILVHGWPWLHHAIEGAAQQLGGLLGGIVSSGVGALVGIVAGAIAVGLVTLIQKLRPSVTPA